MLGKLAEDVAVDLRAGLRRVHRQPEPLGGEDEAGAARADHDERKREGREDAREPGHGVHEERAALCHGQPPTDGTGAGRSR
jgi:hypothetical protein